ncbi:hypothetical protein QQP08_009332 [Theobroma cacao]|uniref:Uncharacterized protein n=1 Tax=Theobroma cacao TaxID=3641 RepID=A0A061G4N0_THECC|nr:Uncharacterized protein TCM_016305 [Theobroma cacao]WRX16845.1 hypothetical protein QQP08_009332 [Theobroma cacao]
MRIWQNICGSQHEWRGSDATPCSSSALLPILSDKYALYKPRQPLAHPYVGGNPTHPTEPRSISPVTTAFVSCLVVVSMPWSPNGNHKNLQYTYAYCSFICHNWPPCLCLYLAQLLERLEECVNTKGDKSRVLVDNWKANFRGETENPKAKQAWECNFRKAFWHLASLGTY